MDKKKIQIAVIIVCMIGTAGIVYWGMFSTSTPEVAAPTGIAPINTNVDSVVDVPTAPGMGAVGDLPTESAKIEYAAPATFPVDSALDLSVYESSKFTNLQDYTPISVTPEEVGRENPFINY